MLTQLHDGKGFAIASTAGQRSSVHYWASKDGNSIISLGAEPTGTFTLCKPDLEHDGLRYGFGNEGF